MQAADLEIIRKRGLSSTSGHPIPAMVSPKSSHFTEVNIIGMNHTALNNAAVFSNPRGGMSETPALVGTAADIIVY